MAVDILAAVYEFVKAYAYNPEDANSKQLTAEQIIRAGLNDAPVVSNSSELCIIAHVSTIRHGTNHYQYHSSILAWRVPQTVKSRTRLSNFHFKACYNI